MLLYLENVPLATGEQIWLQNDEALQHFGTKTMDTRTKTIQKIEKKR
jgi:hypothetical protein